MKPLVFTLLLSASLAGPLIAMEPQEPTQTTQQIHQVTVDDEKYAESYKRRVLECYNIVANLLREFQQMNAHPNKEEIQTYLKNSIKELEKYNRSNDKQTTSLLDFMSNLSIHLSETFGVMFSDTLQDPFKSYNAFILKMIKDKNDALALEEQYKHENQKAPSWTPKELAPYKEIINNIILTLEEEDRQETNKAKSTLDIQLKLKSSLATLEEMVNIGASSIIIEKHLDELIGYLNRALGGSFMSQTVNKLIKLKPHEYGNFPASSKKLDFLLPTRPDLVKIKSSTVDQIAEIKSKALLPHISCWKVYNDGEREKYLPTKSETDEILEKSLNFFQNKENAGQDIFDYKIEKQGEFEKYQIHCIAESGGKAALSRQNRISELKAAVKKAHEDAQDYQGFGQSKTASSMGSIITQPSYTILQYQDYVLNLLNMENLEDVNPKKIKILDIGAATGANDLKLVKMGATLVVNDLESALPNLVDFRARLTSKERKNVWFNTNTFPDKFDQPEASFDAVLMSHVAHYLTGPQIRYGFKKIYKWLNPEGKFFFQALTPYSQPYSWRSKTTTSLKQGGNEWPGWFGQSSKQAEFEFGNKFDKDTFSVYDRSFPTFGHPIDPEILERELKGAGFEIESIFYSYLRQNFVSPLTYKEHEFYVMGGCENDKKTKNDATERSRLIAKIGNLSEYKALLDKDREKYCARKLVMDKGGYPLAQLTNAGIQIIDHFVKKFENIYNLNQEKKEKVLGALEAAKLTLRDQNLSPDQILASLSTELVQLLGDKYDIIGQVSPVIMYYHLTGALDGVQSMESVQAIVKKPKQ